MAENFNDAERAAVYKAIMLRRDIRRQFESTPIPRDVLVRILSAAHHAGSVGFMQPWDFIVVENPETRQRVRDSFLLERERSAQFYEGERRELYLSLKLEGIMESALNLCVTCDPTVLRGHGLVFHGAVLQIHVNFTGACLVTGDRQVNGGRLPDRPADMDCPLGLEAVHRLHQEGDAKQGCGPGGQCQSE